MENSPIQVERLETGIAQGMADTVKPQFDIGSLKPEHKETENTVNALLRAQAMRSQYAFKLTWTGGKIPRGANILGHIIAWTQNGMVTSEKGQKIGTYERTKEFDGPKQDEQEMIVYVD